MARRLWLIGATLVTILGLTAPAWACAGLVAPQGGIELVRTSTLAAYHDGIEHYVTQFEFTGKGGGKFGSIVPLPGVPTKVRKGGRWTLERLALETQPPVVEATSLQSFALNDADEAAKVLMHTRIEALKITVLEGGGDAVGQWAEEHGFLLPPDAPEVLDFYADRSPIFMAVRFDIQEARERDLETGDGTPVHITIPTPNPWVPLRILALGKAASETIDADVYLLTDNRPEILPLASPDSGMDLVLSEEASPDLLEDLQSDRGMGWLPTEDMWLTYLRINTAAANLDHDLAIDASGVGLPSPVAAGLVDPPRINLPDGTNAWWPWVLAAGFGLGVIFVTNRAVVRS